jgi:hypothetical protein
MNRSISLILFMAFIMLSGPVVLPANADPSIHQTGGHILIADNATETSAAVEAATTQAAGQTALPNVMIPEPLFTFDTVVDGTEVVHDFRVYNRGTGEVAIQKVQTG